MKKKGGHREVSAFSLSFVGELRVGAGYAGDGVGGNLAIAAEAVPTWSFLALG